MQLITALPELPPRPANGHKGMFGRVLIVGGHDDMIGAPAMAGTSALRMGAGLVQVAVPRGILLPILTITPELVGLGLGKGVGSELIEAAEKANAIVLGPGLGQTADAKARVARLTRMDKPMVIDADGLNILAAGKKWPANFKAQAVLTPHPGEMARLGKLFGQTKVPSDDKGRMKIALKAAEEFGQVIVLKGQHTIVTDGQRAYVNQTGDSSLSKAGTGDVLSGIIGALLGQKMDRFDAACLGVHLHGRAGEIAGQRLGQRCVLAREVIDALPGAIGEYEAGKGIPAK